MCVGRTVLPSARVSEKAPVALADRETVRPTPILDLYHSIRRRPWRTLALPLQKPGDNSRNLPCVRLEREMSGVVEVDLRVRIVPPKRLRARWQEERIMLAPHRQY